MEYYEIQKGVPVAKKTDTTFLSQKLDEMEVGDSIFVKDVYEALRIQTIARRTERRVTYRQEYQPETGLIPIRVWRIL